MGFDSSLRPVSEEADHELLARVAWYYYRDELTQAQIATRLHVSRPTIARLLARARQTGVVTIEVNTEGVGGIELTAGLRELFGLQDVVVVPRLGATTSGDETNSAIAKAGAQYLRRYLEDGSVIGVGWGDTVLRTLLALRRQSLSGVTFATLTGGIDAYTTKVSGATNSGLADFIRFVPAPLLASSPRIAQALRREKSVTAVLDLARSADATLIGIGGAVPNATILQNGVVSEEQLRYYQAAGAVGDILGEWYDANGRVLAGDLQKVRVGVAIREFRRMRNVIAVAGGSDKVEAIRGALAGGYIDVLITTEDVARLLMEPQP
ncbi:MAG: putative SorC family transcriptional regulator [Cryobacterium sp.]|nr:putative SorC family transcriptional regulator [Cryobacterium sp.]